MKFLMRLLPLIVTIMVLCSAAHATSSLSFQGGGYWLDLEIGYTDHPVVASIKFHKPGDTQGVVLRGNFKVEAFHPDRKQLILLYSGGDSRVAPFKLTALGERATLEAAGASIDSTFSWFK